MAFSRITACIFALENCEYERWRVPGPRVTANPFANMAGAIVSKAGREEGEEEGGEEEEEEEQGRGIPPDEVKSEDSSYDE